MGIAEMKFVTILLVLAVLRGTDAATYVVGDSLGWTIPSGGAATYATWAAKQTYAPGDVLVFNFAAGIHDVATVTKAAYDSCSSTSPTSLMTISPANVTLTTAGAYYFICTFGTHCSLGQKLTLNVLSTSAASPPTAATPPPMTATPPPMTATPPPMAATPPPMAATPPPMAATPPPASATSPTMTPMGAPPTMSPTMSPTSMPPTTPPTAATPAPAPGPSMISDGPSSPTMAPPPGADMAPAPTGETTSPPSPGSASRGAVATVAIGFGFAVFMSIMC